METPDTMAGFLTECIMSEITRKIGKMPTHNYNAIYSGVLETLDKWLPEVTKAHKDGLSRKEFIMKGFC